MAPKQTEPSPHQACRRYLGPLCRCRPYSAFHVPVVGSLHMRSKETWLHSNHIVTLKKTTEITRITIPRTKEVFDALGGSSVFSVFVLFVGFTQFNRLPGCYSPDCFLDLPRTLRITAHAPRRRWRPRLFQPPSITYVCVCVFIKLHITSQFGPVVLFILCHSH